MSNLNNIKRKYLNKINSYEDEFKSLSDEELKAKTKYFRNLLENGKSLEYILPEVFAVVREVSDILNTKTRFEALKYLIVDYVLPYF